VILEKLRQFGILFGPTFVSLLDQKRAQKFECCIPNSTTLLVDLYMSLMDRKKTLSKQFYVRAIGKTTTNLWFFFSVWNLLFKNTNLTNFQGMHMGQILAVIIH
jgi:hypothetical protein